MFWGTLGFGGNTLLMRVLLQPIYEGTQSAPGFQWAQKGKALPQVWAAEKALLPL